MKPTNKPEVNITSVNFAALLSEGLGYVDAWTPTFINKGGCGIFARELCDRLDKTGISYKIFAIFYDKDDEAMSNLKDYLKTGNNLDKSGAQHITVMIADTLYVDSTGIINGQVMCAIEKLELTKEILISMIEKSQWNPMFDKGCIPAIEEKLDIVFTHLKDFHSGIFPMPTPTQVRLTAYTLKMKKKVENMSLMNLIMRS